jgi:hypothetical protein
MPLLFQHNDNIFRSFILYIQKKINIIQNLMDSEHKKSLFLKKYIIKGTEIDLYIKFKLRRNIRNNGYNLEIKIPFPSNYPLTELKESLNELFEAFITIYDTNMDPFKPIEDTDEENDEEEEENDEEEEENDEEEDLGDISVEEDTEALHNTSLEHFDRIKEMLGMGHIENIIYIEAFYILSRKNNIRERPEERSMLRGLGKTVICKVFNDILTTKFQNINELNSIVLLDAGGGGVITDEDFVRYDKYSLMDKNDVLELLKHHYPEYYEEEFQDYNDSWDIPLTLVSLENNQNLTAYYTNTFGFKVVTFHSLFTPMVVPLYTYLEKCGN